MNQLLGPGVVLTEVLCASYVLLLHQPKKAYFPLRFLCSIAVCYLSLILWLIPGNEFSNMMKYFTIYLLVFLSILASMIRLRFWNNFTPSLICYFSTLKFREKMEWKQLKIYDKRIIRS